VLDVEFADGDERGDDIAVGLDLVVDKDIGVFFESGFWIPGDTTDEV